LPYEDLSWEARVDGPEVLKTFLGGRVSVLVGDITEQDVDAIVNAANWTLLGGGGVDGAIHEEGGPQILEECREIRRTLHPQGLPTGEAVITSAGRLPARFVIHTVGPIKGVWGEGDAEKLANCYRNSLVLAAQHALRSIAFPAISTGIYAYPRDQAAIVASGTIVHALESFQVIEEVRLVFYSRVDARIFLENHKFTCK
jgi:O-acetyl-ADP-ribose deacetylase (regulator of RNase III)